jgi:hypothetical protein
MPNRHASHAAHDVEAPVRKAPSVRASASPSVMSLQRMVGNQATLQLLRSGQSQAVVQRSCKAGCSCASCGGASMKAEEDSSSESLSHE